MGGIPNSRVIAQNMFDPQIWRVQSQGPKKSVGLLIPIVSMYHCLPCQRKTLKLSTMVFN